MKLKDLLKTVQDVVLTPEQEKQIKEYLGIKETKRWKPNHCETYWFLTSSNDVSNTPWSNYCDLDVDHFAIGNCFKTKKEAEFVAEKIKVYLELKQFADENNDPIEWENPNAENYHIYFLYEENNLKVSGCWRWQDIGQIYFSSKELAEQAIQKVGEDRIKKYLFGVE